MKHSLVGAVLLATSCNDYKKEKRREDERRTARKKRASIQQKGPKQHFFRIHVLTIGIPPPNKGHNNNTRTMGVFCYLLFLLICFLL
jgi:hypothetical protein